MIKAEGGSAFRGALATGHAGCSRVGGFRHLWWKTISNIKGHDVLLYFPVSFSSAYVSGKSLRVYFRVRLGNCLLAAF